MTVCESRASLLGNSQAVNVCMNDSIKKDATLRAYVLYMTKDDFAVQLKILVILDYY